VQRDFRLQVFYMDQFPPAPDYIIRAISNFSKIRGDIRRSRCTPPVTLTRVAKFAAGVVDTGGAP
jgi:hypothetical protein